MIATTTVPATDKQTGFISKLLTEKKLTVTTVASINAELGAGISKMRASNLISYLLKQPRATVALTVAAPSPLDGLPHSRYALDTDLLRLTLTSVAIDTNDTLFVEIREYKGRTYMRRLVGNPGDFLRFRVSREDERVIADAIRVNPLEAAQRFGERFAVCGKCGAPLTDEESRRLSLGPVCKGAFGL